MATMKKSEVQIGHVYIVKVSGKLAKVKLVTQSYKGGLWLCWNGINLETKRRIRIRTAARLRREFIPECSDCQAEVGRRAVNTLAGITKSEWNDVAKRIEGRRKSRPSPTASEIAETDDRRGDDAAQDYVPGGVANNTLNIQKG